MRASRLRHLRFASSKKDVYIFLPFLELSCSSSHRAWRLKKDFRGWQGDFGDLLDDGGGFLASLGGEMLLLSTDTGTLERTERGRVWDIGSIVPHWLHSAGFLKSGLGSQTTHPIKPCIEVVPTPHTRIDKISTVG